MKKSLHIHFWGHVKNQAGSVEKLVLTFARHQTRYLSSIACKGERNIDEEVDGLTVHSFAESALKNRLLNKLLGLHAFTFDSLVPIVEKERPDVLHIHNRQELVDRLVARLSYRPAVIVHYHRNFAQPSVPQTADLLLAVSDATRQHIINTSGTNKPFEVLHNPLTDALLKYPPISNPNNSRPIILFGGGQVERKGFPEFMQAIPRLRGDFMVKICGPNLETYVPDQDNIEVLGLIPYDQFIREMQQADIVAMPSRKEPFALMALEALYLGKLLVASKDGGFAEMLGSDYAILTEPGDVSSLTTGLQTALDMITSNDERAGRLRKAAQTIADNYKPEAVAERLEDFYDAALAFAASRT